MRLSRLIAVFAAAALCFGGVAVASPASAASYTTTATITYLSKTAGIYGDSYLVQGQVRRNDGLLASGTTYLEMVRPGGTWQVVDTRNYGSVSYFGKVDGNVQFRVRFPGGANSGDNYGAATSAPVALKAYRLVDGKDIRKKQKLFLGLTVTPNYGGKKVVIQTYKCKKKKPKKGKKCAWKGYKKPRLNSSGYAKIRIKGAIGQKFQLTVPGDANFQTSTIPFKIVRKY